MLKFEAGEAPQQQSRVFDIQEILNYREALWRAQDELRTRPFNLNLLLELHSVLLDSVRGREKARGQFRRSQNWIGPAGCPIQHAEFVPPHPLVLNKYISAWEKYYHQETPDLLVQLAIVHAQFEIVHPFMDGNGRLGRILIPLFLFEKQLLSRPVFYLSSYFERNRDEYVNCLRALGRQKGAWNRWIEFFLVAITRQAEANTEAARSIIDLYERLKERVITLTHSRFAIPILDVLFEHPVLSTRHFEKRSGLPSKPMIMELLKKFRTANILSVIREASGSRAQILLFKELFDLCEATHGAK